MGFRQDRLLRLAQLEEWHFWFVGRQALLDRLLRQCPGPDRAGLVVDLGCGTGRMVRRLAERGYRAVGVDFRPEGLLRASRAAPGSGWVQADGAALPLREASADLVLMLDVVEHADDEALLAEAARVLRDSGTAVVLVPAFPWLWSFRDEDAGHLRRYTRRQLLERLHGAGLTVHSVEYYQFLLFPLVAAGRLLGRTRHGLRDAEEGPPRLLNRLLGWVNRLEVRLGAVVAWPWGSSLAAVCTKVAP